MTPPKKKYQSRHRHKPRKIINNDDATTSKERNSNKDSDISTTLPNIHEIKAMAENERTPLITKKTQSNKTELETTRPSSSKNELRSVDNENLTSYHGQIVKEKHSERLLVQSSGSSSAMSTYGTTTETVIEKTLQRLNSISQVSEVIKEKDHIEAPNVCPKNDQPNISNADISTIIGSQSTNITLTEEISPGITGVDIKLNEGHPPSNVCHNNRLRDDNVTRTNNDQFAKRPLFSSLTMSNEFQLISSADMKTNFNMLMNQQLEKQMVDRTSHVVVYDNNEEKDTTRHIRTCPSSNDAHQNHRLNYQQFGQNNRYVMNQYSHLLNIYIKPFLLGLLIITCFVLTTFGNKHFAEADGVVWSAMVVIFMYVLIIFELVHRTLAAIIGAVLAVTLYSCLKEIPTLEEITTWVNIETLVLLFGMMIIVAILSETGIFNYMAIWFHNKADGRFWLLLGIMYITTAVFSAFIDNVSTMLLMTPIIIRLSELQQLDPRLILMLMIVVSNIGGCATPVGDPPNIIVISDSLMKQQGVDFVSFVFICAPGVIIIMVWTFIYIRLAHGSMNTFKYDQPLAVVELEHEIDIWTKVRDYLPKLTQNHTTVRHHIDGQINQLRTCLNKKLYYEGPAGLEGIIQMPFYSNIRQQDVHVPVKHQRNMNDNMAPHPNYHHHSVAFENNIKELTEKHAIKDRCALILPCLVLVVTIVLFFLESFPWSHLNSLAWISLFAGIALLVFNSSGKVPNNCNGGGGSERESGNGDSVEGFEAIISKVEWSTLIFFSSLFIVMEVISKLGLILYIGQKIIQMIDLLPVGHMRSSGAVAIILWSSGIVSAIIDNVPFTAMMVKILSTIILEQQHKQSLPDSSTVSLLPIRAMIYALLFGACLGGNGTLIGASANLVTAGVSERLGYPIGYNQFLKFALPITVMSLVIANIYLIVVFEYII